jgi:uncharacterized protein (PEP-CTERM system associated)
LLGLIESDPLLRAAVQRRLGSGLDPTAAVNLGFLQSGATAQTQHGLSLAWTGTRQLVTLSATGGQTLRADPLATLVGDLALTPEVRQAGLNFSASHRLTPDATVGLGLQAQRSSGGQAVLHNTQRSAELNVSSRLSRENTVTMALRRSMINNGTAPGFDENSLTVSLAARF